MITMKRQVLIGVTSFILYSGFTTILMAQPQMVPPPFLPGDPNQVPVGGSLFWALGGGIYSIHKLRRIHQQTTSKRREDFGNQQEIQS